MTKKLELLEKAKRLKLDVSSKNTITEIETAILAAEATLKPEKVAKIEKDTAVVDDSIEDDEKHTKAGKRSEKSLKEAEEKVAKEERKAQHDTTPQSEEPSSHVKKGAKPITRTKLERRGKNYRKVAEFVDGSKIYSLNEAMDVVVKTNPSKFDASVEIHVRMGVDQRQADQNIRATVSLPNGTGKSVRVAVFAPEAELAAAKTAGAEIAGDEEFLKMLDKGEINFDTLISTPQYMPKLGKYARLLGPRGLMPNPKSGTVSANISKAVTEAKAGKVEYRLDKQSIVHLAIGKVSFGPEKLIENAKTFVDSLKAQKPSGFKGIYVKSISVSTTQGPGIKTENIVG